MSGEELVDYLTDKDRRNYLNPELQAELSFGVEQLKEVALATLEDNFNIFLDNKKEWEGVNNQILAARRDAVQLPFPAIDELRAAVCYEVEFQEQLWQGDYETALDCAGRVLGKLTLPELQGYRALWHYLAGSAGWLGAESGVPRMRTKALAHFAQAKGAATGIP